ncbi:MAG: NfeD family protein [Actinomycetota bacterium]
MIATASAGRHGWLKLTWLWVAALAWGLVPLTVVAALSEVEVIEVSGLLDDDTLRYLRVSIEDAAEAQREVAIVQLDSPGVVGTEESLASTIDLLADPPLPVVVWLGPAPARAGGGAAHLLAVAPIRAGAPGAKVETWLPSIADTNLALMPPPPGVDLPILIQGKVPGLVDVVVPSIRQLVQALDGFDVEVRGTERTLRTITDSIPEGVDEEGVTTIPVTFTQPGLWHRILHLAARPESAFFLLTLSLTLTVFEFFALGPGVSAAVAGAGLTLAVSGMARLPIRWVGVTATMLAIILFTAGLQRGGMLIMTLVATGLLTWAGFNFAGGAPQVQTAPAGVAFAVVTTLFFFMLAIPTVVRARLSTKAIGRHRLIGRQGKALADFAPGGVVEIDGARWPATAHREAGIREGSKVVVTGIEGQQLAVSPDREN